MSGTNSFTSESPQSSVKNLVDCYNVNLKEMICSFLQCGVFWVSGLSFGSQTGLGRTRKESVAARVSLVVWCYNNL